MEIVFENGETKIFDLTPFLQIGEFKRLADRNLFCEAKVVAGSVEWPGELDLSFDTLYLKSIPVSPPPSDHSTNRISVVAEDPPEFGPDKL